MNEDFIYPRRDPPLHQLELVEGRWCCNRCPYVLGTGRVDCEPVAKPVAPTEKKVKHETPPPGDYTFRLK